MDIVPREAALTYSGSPISRPPAHVPRTRWPGSGVRVRRGRSDVAEVAVLLPVVQAVAHGEVVGDVPPDVLHLERHPRRVRLAQERADLDAGGVADRQVGGDP